MSEQSVQSYRFDHVGFITSNVDYLMAGYAALGCQTMERSYRKGAFDLGYFGAGTDVLLEVQGPPLLAESEEYIARQGHSIERVALVCDDVEAGYRRLIDAGVQSAWAPEPFVVDGVSLAIAAGVWSPEGLMIDLVQHQDVAVPRPQRAERGDLALHHACCLTPDLAAAERFWTEQLGLTKLYDFTTPLPTGEGTRGFIMLGDSFFDADGHEFTLEIIGGEFDSIDGPVFERRGACYDHICFTTGDVEATWTKAVERGVEPLSEPAFYPEYDATIAWLYDADGTHVELMSPLPPGILLEARRTGVCSNHWVDDWQRNPPVKARRGDGPVEVRR
jgi:catechol 2,3-dioxygenase-like lactoylglutathione lyase family enzyme